MPKKAGKGGAITTSITFDHTHRVEDNARARASDVVTKTTLDIEGSAKMNATGRPGPNVITGTLRGGIRGYVDPGGLTGRVSVQAFYGAYLEFGTVHAPPYPFFFRAVEQHRPAFQAAMRRVVTA